jgi:hypothetical protein
MKKCFAIIVAAGSMLFSTRADAQQSAPSGYPNVDKPLAVSPVDTVQFLIRVINEGAPATRPSGRRLDVLYATRIPASDPAARQAQADRAAEFFGPDAIEIGARRLSIGICDTRACAERRDPPAAWYLYERTNNGWRRSR